MPPKSLVRTAEKQVPSASDLDLAASLATGEMGDLDMASTTWLKEFSSRAPTKPLGIITCSSTVTALSAIVDSITALCNDGITPLYTDSNFSPTATSLDAIARQLASVSDELSSISARFKARQQQLNCN